MTKATNDEVRKLFTQIGCIMEDASVAALLWKDGDALDVAARYWEISDVHAKISELLSRIYNLT
jgi:hypothetical protein